MSRSKLLNRQCELILCNKRLESVGIPKNNLIHNVIDTEYNYRSKIIELNNLKVLHALYSNKIFAI